MCSSLAQWQPVEDGDALIPEPRNEGEGGSHQGSMQKEHRATSWVHCSPDVLNRATSSVGRDRTGRAARPHRALQDAPRDLPALLLVLNPPEASIMPPYFSILS